MCYLIVVVQCKDGAMLSPFPELVSLKLAHIVYAYVSSPMTRAY